MVGRKSAAYKGKRYQNYWCSRAMRSRALCSTYNGHSAVKMEKVVLEYLGQFSYPELVAQHLATARGKDLEDRERELKEVQKALTELERQFLQHLDLLKRGIISEPEFVKSNEVARSQVGALEPRRDELSTWLEEQQGKVAAAEGPSDAIRSFLEDFQELDVRRQKAQLQTILQAAYVYRDDRLELEFRA